MSRRTFANLNNNINKEPEDAAPPKSNDAEPKGDDTAPKSGAGHSHNDDLLTELLKRLPELFGDCASKKDLFCAQLQNMRSMTNTLSHLCKLSDNPQECEETCASAMNTLQYTGDDGMSSCQDFHI